jgi:hypothetical protein
MSGPAQSHGRSGGSPGYGQCDTSTPRSGSAFWRPRARRVALAYRCHGRAHRMCAAALRSAWLIFGPAHFWRDVVGDSRHPFDLRVCRALGPGHQARLRNPASWPPEPLTREEIKDAHYRLLVGGSRRQRSCRDSGTRPYPQNPVLRVLRGADPCPFLGSAAVGIQLSPVRIGISTGASRKIATRVAMPRRRPLGGPESYTTGAVARSSSGVCYAIAAVSLTDNR